MGMNQSSLATAIANAFAAAQGLQTPSSAQTTLANSLASAIVSAVQGGTVTITPAQVAAAALANGGGPVAATNNMNGSIS